MMKQINWENLSRRNEYSIDQFIERGVDMEFIKVGDKYLVKGSNSLIVDEKEKLQMEKKELIIQDITGTKCQGETTKRIKKINKKLEEVEANDTNKETD